jgi:hypothetical protein
MLREDQKKWIDHLSNDSKIKIVGQIQRRDQPNQVFINIFR